MLCEKYKDALIEAAVGDEELAPDVSAHVTSCASCAAELAQQRSLAAAIDGNMSRQMNAPVPAAMLRRFEAHVAQQATTVPIRSPRLRFVYAFASVAVVASIILFVSHSRSSKTDPRIVRLTRAIPGASPASATSPYISHLPPRANTVVLRAKRHKAETNGQKQAEVIVPPGQELLLAEYAQKLRKQTVVLQASLRGPAEIEPSEILVNEIRSIDIKPLPVLDTN